MGIFFFSLIFSLFFYFKNISFKFFPRFRLNPGLYRLTLKAPTMNDLETIEIRVVPSGVPTIGPYWIKGADCLENQRERNTPLAIRSIKAHPSKGFFSCKIVALFFFFFL